ncbi:MAG: PIN domain-containing protein [Microscillaceae bacterium]|jgi:predicted nucleic acid-binding protein|nr:PIN domain-containing protein [Microscillaceae bacterium]
MRYIFDTNVLIHLIRNSTTWQYIDAQYMPFDKGNQAFISFVSVAEVLSIAKQLGWGQAKMNNLALLFSEIEIVTASGSPDDLLIQSYVEIDSYSQGKNPQIPLPKNTSARNMGKNDIWIASTAYALQAQLITTDKDFEHLHQIFFEMFWVEQK